MKVNFISKIKIPLLMCGLTYISPISSQIINNNNSVITTPVALSKDTVELSVSPSGTTAESILRHAPDPQIYIKDELKSASIVVDISRNILYKYDSEGKAKAAYLVTTGKPDTPTTTGVRIVTHIETFPYSSAPANTRRRRFPNSFGPKVICVENINPQTGKRSITGEFIHGNNNSKCLGKYASLGCIRMDNEVIKNLSKQIKKGDIVIIQDGNN